MTVSPSLAEVIALMDAAFEAEIVRVSTLEYNSKEICRHFYGELRKRIATSAASLPDEDARDAARWRALIGCARVRMLGSAGLYSDTDPNGNPFNGYAHIGLELWTHHDGGNEPGDAVEKLTLFADKCVALPAQPAAQERQA